MYTGIDPTASALHVGHLVPLMCMLHFHLRGHDVISLVRLHSFTMRMYTNSDLRTDWRRDRNGRRSHRSRH